jgi:hypothetical protein
VAKTKRLKLGGKSNSKSILHHIMVFKRLYVGGGIIIFIFFFLLSKRVPSKRVKVKVKEGMSVPHTSTHALSLRYHNDLGTKDSLGNKPVAELRHPVQRIIYRDGSGNPVNYDYDGFYELDELLPMMRNPLFKLDLNDFDDVQWNDVHLQANTTSPWPALGVLQSNYLYDTPQRLQTERELQQRAKLNKDHSQQMMHRIRQARAAMQRANDMTAVGHQTSSSSSGSSSVPYYLGLQPQSMSQTSYYTTTDTRHAGYEDLLEESMRHMNLRKRRMSEIMSEDGGGKRRYESSMT